MEKLSFESDLEFLARKIALKHWWKWGRLTLMFLEGYNHAVNEDVKSLRQQLFDSKATSQTWRDNYERVQKQLNVNQTEHQNMLRSLLTVPLSVFGDKTALGILQEEGGIDYVTATIARMGYDHARHLERTIGDVGVKLAQAESERDAVAAKFAQSETAWELERSVRQDLRDSLTAAQRTINDQDKELDVLRGQVVSTQVERDEWTARAYEKVGAVDKEREAALKKVAVLQDENATLERQYNEIRAELRQIHNACQCPIHGCCTPHVLEVLNIKSGKTKKRGKNASKKKAR